MHRVGYWKNCFRCRRRGEKPRGLFGRGGAGAHVQMMNGHGLALRPGRSGDAKPGCEIGERNHNQNTKPENRNPYHQTDELLAVAEVHEEENDDRSFANRDSESHNRIEGTQIDVGHTRRQGRKAEEDNPNKDVNLFSLHVRDKLRHTQSPLSNGLR